MGIASQTSSLRLDYIRDDVAEVMLVVGQVVGDEESVPVHDAFPGHLDKTAIVPDLTEVAPGVALMNLDCVAVPVWVVRVTFPDVVSDKPINEVLGAGVFRGTY